jgi:plasmid stability protein
MHYGFFMSTITLKNVPDSLHAALRSRARNHGRSLNKEVICALEQVLANGPPDANSLLSEAQAVREEMTVYMTQRDLDAMRQKGRA